MVALSSTKAEYISLIEAVKEIVWLKGMVSEFGINESCVTVFCNNQNAIYLSKHHVFTNDLSILMLNCILFGI